MQTIDIDIQNEHGFAVDEARLRDAIALVVGRHAPDVPLALAVVVTTDSDVQRLNSQFRGVDSPTDVLSFPSGEPLDTDDDEPAYLGDLVIAWPYAAAQAQREGHEMQDSLVLLVIHGVLHLLGFDHGTSEEKKEMWAAQAEALTALGISPEIVPALENASHDE
jgi:probable rRNA maturation factor